jgi:hypothetical protein
LYKVTPNIKTSAKKNNNEVPTIEELMKADEVPSTVRFKKEEFPLMIENTVELVNTQPVNVQLPPRIDS